MEKKESQGCGWILTLALLAGFPYFLGYLWDVAQILMIIILLSPLWLLVGGVFGGRVANCDDALQKSGKEFVEEIARLEASALRIREERKQERRALISAVQQRIDERNLKMQNDLAEIDRQAQLFELKLMRSHAAEEIFALSELRQMMNQNNRARENISTTKLLQSES